jgi:hypothetical protein
MELYLHSPCAFLSCTVTSLPLSSVVSFCIKLTPAICDVGSACGIHGKDEKCIRFGRKA